MPDSPPAPAASASSETPPGAGWAAGGLHAGAVRRSVGIVGSGPSALYTLKELIASPIPLAVTIFEAGPRAGVGTPYDPARNAPSMLANIASIELPPLVDRLSGWLAGRGDAELARLGVGRAAITERAFFPRIAIGAYFADQLLKLRRMAAARGHAVRIRTAARIEDIAAHPGHAVVVARAAEGRLRRHRFDRVVVATGHQHKPRASELTIPRAYAGARRLSPTPGRIGILGSSLSAIDVAVSLALAHGAFIEDGEGLSYRHHDGGRPLHVTFLSRRGLLPEADFHFPFPYEPLRHCTAGAIDALIGSGRRSLLDKAFALFIRELTAADPAFAAGIGAASLTADTVAEAFFARRMAADPFAWAALNLREAMADAAERRTAPWRYAVLRMADVFARIVPHLGKRDLRRFHGGIKAVFVDNYAAVPHLSVKRILALHAAGAASLVRLDPAYRITGGPPPRTLSVETGGRMLTFDGMVDALGQMALGAEDLPFPTLRAQVRADMLSRANEGSGDGPDEADGIDVTDSFELATGQGPFATVHLIAIPYLLSRRPFVQGVTASRDMGAAVGRAIIGGLSGAEPAASVMEPDVSSVLADYRRTAASTIPIYCLDSGVTLTTPRSRPSDLRRPLQPSSG